MIKVKIKREPITIPAIAPPEIPYSSCSASYTSADDSKTSAPKIVCKFSMSFCTSSKSSSPSISPSTSTEPSLRDSILIKLGFLVNGGPSYLASPFLIFVLKSSYSSKGKSILMKNFNIFLIILHLSPFQYSSSLQSYEEHLLPSQVVPSLHASQLISFHTGVGF